MLKSLFLIITVMLSYQLYSQPANSAWPMHRHDARHTGRSSFYGPDSAKVIWTYKTNGRIRSEPVFDEAGNIYFGSGDSTLYSLYPNGDLRWKFKADSPIETSPAIDQEGIIYFSTRYSIYALYPNRIQKWRFEGILASGPSPILGEDGTIYLAIWGSGHLYALNSDKTMKWEFNVGSYINPPSIDANGAIILGSGDSSLYAINPESGSIKWQYKHSSAFRGTPVIGNDGNIYIRGENDKMLAVNQEGDFLWLKSYPLCNTDAAIDSDNHMYYRFGGNLFSFFSDGDLNWKVSNTDVGTTYNAAPTISDEGDIYVSFFNGKLMALDNLGARKWIVELGGEIFTSPVMDGKGYLYVGSDDSTLYVVGPKQENSTPSLQFIPSVLGFGVLPAGENFISWASIKNNSNEVLAISNIYLAGDDSEYFTLFDPPSFIELQPSDTIGLNILFQAHIPGKMDAYLVVISNSLESPDTLLLSAYTSANSAAWPMAGHDHRNTSFSHFKGPDVPNVLWKKPDMGNPYEGPVIGTDEIIYIGGSDLHALYPNNSTYWTLNELSGIVSSPAINDAGEIYLGTLEGKFYAIYPDGAIKWEYLADAGIGTSPALSYDGNVYFGCVNGDFYSLTHENEFNWKINFSFEPRPTPAIGDDGTIYLFADSLYAVNPNDGSFKWTKEFYAGRSAPMLGHDGTIYLCSNGNFIVAIDPETGATKWKYRFSQPEINEGVYRNPAIAPDGTVYITSHDQHLYALTMDGRFKWKFQLSDYDTLPLPVHSGPVVDGDGVIYVGSADSNLYAINPDGSMKWTYKTGNKVLNNPVIGKNGRLYVAVPGDGFYCFAEDIVNSPPAIQLPALNDTAYAGQPYQYVPIISDNEQENLVLTLLNGPAWLEVINNTHLEGTPGFSANGESEVIIQVDDLHGGITDTSYILTMVNQSPPSPVTDLSLIGLPAAGSVWLKWTAPGDHWNQGTAISYDLRYSDIKINEDNFDTAQPVTGLPTPAIVGSADSVEAGGLETATFYYFAIKTLNSDDSLSAISNVLKIFIDGENSETPPEIISHASSVGQVDVPYKYNAANQAQAIGSQPITWTKISGPDGFAITGEGQINWMPDTLSAEKGSVLIIIRAGNAFGSADDSITVAFPLYTKTESVVSGEAEQFLDFSEASVTMSDFTNESGESGTITVNAINVSPDDPGESTAFSFGEQFWTIDASIPDGSFSTTLIFYYDETKIGDITESDLVMRYRENAEDNWKVYPDQDLDVVNNKLTILNINHFSMFACSDNPVVTAIEPGSSISKTFHLYQNYPNPFNPATVIRYRLPVASNVKLIVYNLLGQRVWQQKMERQAAGMHQVTVDLGTHSSGIYFYRVQAEGYQAVKKMLLLK